MPIKERASFANVERGNLDVLDGAFVLVDANGVRTQIPVGGLTCVMIEPGVRITHAAVALAARCGTLLLWVGEAGVRLYSSGQPGGARSDRLLWQAATALDGVARLAVVRDMYRRRFGETAPSRRSAEQLRGIEGARVKGIYSSLAKRYGVKWGGRSYDPKDATSGDLLNRCLSQSTSCLYGICEAAILAAGYAPAIGFLHTGKPQSFVYDVADVYKFSTVIPVAFSVAARHMSGKSRGDDPMGDVRRACRDAFRESRILTRLVPDIEAMIAAGGLPVPGAPDEAQPVAFESETSGDDGHRG